MEIKLDYLTVNFDAGCADIVSISKALSRDNLFFNQRKSSDNALFVSPFGLSYLHNSGWDPRPHRLQVSGVGCRHFESTLPNLKLLAENRGGDISISRIDFAFDYPIHKSEWKEYIKKAFSASIDSDRQRKKYTIAGNGEAMTVYIGSRLSDAYFRIYNKTLESKGKYVYTQNGIEIDVPDDYYVIRFEIELKRHVHHRRDECTIFDPTPLFYQYISADEDLLKYIKDLWMEYGDDVILLPDFENEELTYSNENKNFVQISNESALNIVQDRLYDEPKTFSSTVEYVVSHFAKYLPFIYSDQFYIDQCEIACKQFCGFVPEYPVDYMIQRNCKLHEFEEDEIVLDAVDPFQYTIFPEVTNES